MYMHRLACTARTSLVSCVPVGLGGRTMSPACLPDCCCAPGKHMKAEPEHGPWCGSISSMTCWGCRSHSSACTASTWGTARSQTTRGSTVTSSHASTPSLIWRSPGLSSSGTPPVGMCTWVYLQDCIGPHLLSLAVLVLSFAAPRRTEHDSASGESHVIICIATNVQLHERCPSFI